MAELLSALPSCGMAKKGETSATADGCEIHQLVGDLFHYNFIIYNEYQ